MKQNVTVVPHNEATQGLIIVEGEALSFSFPAPENLNALQWYGQEGHIEWTDDINHPLTLQDYEDDVSPFVTLWETEKTRLETEAREQAEAAEALYNSTEERAKRIRAERDTRLGATQWLIERHADEVTGDLPTTLSVEQYATLLTYRQALREIPEQDGFPWEGEETAPWPVLTIY